MKRFLEHHPLLKVSVMFIAAAALAFAAHYHFANRSFFLFLTDLPFLVLFVYFFFDGITGVLASSKATPFDSKNRKK